MMGIHITLLGLSLILSLLLSKTDHLLNKFVKWTKPVRLWCNQKRIIWETDLSNGQNRYDGVLVILMILIMVLL